MLSLAGAELAALWMPWPCNWKARALEEHSSENLAVPATQRSAGWAPVLQQAGLWSRVAVGKRIC